MVTLVLIGATSPAHNEREGTGRAPGGLEVFEGTPPSAKQHLLLLLFVLFRKTGE